MINVDSIYVNYSRDKYLSRTFMILLAPILYVSAHNCSSLIVLILFFDLYFADSDFFCLSSILLPKYTFSMSLQNQTKSRPFLLQ